MQWATIVIYRMGMNEIETIKRDLPRLVSFSDHATPRLVEH